MATGQHLLDYTNKQHSGQDQTLFKHVANIIHATVSDKNPAKGVEKI